MGMKPRQYHAMGQTPPEDGKGNRETSQSAKMTKVDREAGPKMAFNATPLVESRTKMGMKRETLVEPKMAMKDTRIAQKFTEDNRSGQTILVGKPKKI